MAARRLNEIMKRGASLAARRRVFREHQEWGDLINLTSLPPCPEASADCSIRRPRIHSYRNGSQSWKFGKDGHKQWLASHSN